MPTATGNVILFLVTGALLGFAFYVLTRGKSGDRNENGEAESDLGLEASQAEQDRIETAEETALLDACCEELRQEIAQLEELLERLGFEIRIPVDDTVVVDLQGPQTDVGDTGALLDQRDADARAAFGGQVECPDWEQDSPELVSIIAHLADLRESAFVESSEFTESIEPDDLKQIRGIGKVLEGVLNAKGIHTFEQLATLSVEDVEALSKELKHFGDRVGRDRWIEQAQALAAPEAG